MRDFEAYYAAGVTWNHGGDAYSRQILRAERTVPGVSANRQETLPFVNPPFVLPFLGALARLPFGTAALLWGVLLAIAAAALIATSLSLAGARDWRVMAAAVPLALAFGPISSDLALGQAALLAVTAAVCATWALARHRVIPAAIATAAALLQPALALPLAVWVRSSRGALALLSGTALVALIWFLTGTPATNLLAYAATLRAHGAAERLALIQYSPAAIVYGLGASAGVASGLTLVFGIVAVATVVCVLLRAQTPVVPFVVACASLPFAIPFFHEHDFTIAWFPSLFVLIRYGADPRRSSIALLATLLIAIDWFGLGQRPGGLTQALALLLAVTAAALAIAPAAGARALIALVPAALVCIAGLAARAHPMPVWPDAMQPFSVPQTAPIATVWHAEQAASGMFAREPFWAAFRLLPLLGCALIAWLAAKTVEPANSQASG